MTRNRIASVAALSGMRSGAAALNDLAAVERAAQRCWFCWGNRMLFDLGDADSWVDELAIDRRRGVHG